MSERNGERGEPTDVDLEWEYMVAANEDRTTAPPWHTVTHDGRPAKCWGDDFYPNGVAHSCFDNATTDVGLCDRHERELIPDAVSDSAD